jgi:hypothetical protein
MLPHQCAREADVLEAVTSGRWPDGCDVSLRAHAESCDVCRDLVEVAMLVQQDGAALRADVRVPSAGSVWWRAQVRARAEAEQAVMRPMLVVGACGATALVALIAAALTLGMPWTMELLVDSAAMLARVQPSVELGADLLPTALGVLERWLVPVLLVGVLVVAAPVALYFADRGQV